MKTRVNIFWFRRDLRLDDNAGLYHALRDGTPVLPIFIFDRHILDELEDRDDRRVAFIYQAVEKLQEALTGLGSTIDARYGSPLDVFKELEAEYTIGKVFTNADYEPYATERDAMVARWLNDKGIALQVYKDQVIFEKGEILKEDGKPYTVFTPYATRWLQQVNAFYLKTYPVNKYAKNFFQQPAKNIPSLATMNFAGIANSKTLFPEKVFNKDILLHYADRRDFPGIAGTSRLSVHLRFGTISIRKLASEAAALNQTFLKELIWRDFYQSILWHFPKVVSHAFKPGYDKIPWRNNEKEFAAWCQGLTGYPIVDAGMRELNATGYMHNRVRMIVASFLTKHLLVDWRWGEAYFARRLLDYDLAANNGGWQWAAGSGCDAAPYFRIFNPSLQTKKFDANLVYIRKWIPELDELTYPLPIVEHESARKRCLEIYQAALKK